MHSSIGSGGYEIPWLHLTQLGVTTTYQLDLSIAEMKEKAQSVSESKLAISTATIASSHASSNAPASTTAPSQTAPITQSGSATILASPILSQEPSTEAAPSSSASPLAPSASSTAAETILPVRRFPIFIEPDLMRPFIVIVIRLLC